MDLLLKLHLSSYFKCYCTISVMGYEKYHINLFNDYIASIYVNGKCKHKHITPFYMLRYTSQVCRLTDFLLQVH